MFNVSMFNVDLRPRVGEFLSARGKLFCRARPPSVSFISTLQRYDILIAVYEYASHFLAKIWSRVSCVTSVNKPPALQYCHNIYNINIILIL